MNETPPVDLQEIQQLLDERRYKEAEKRLTEAIDAAPDNGELHAYLALALLPQERFAPAAEEAKKAATKAPDNPFCNYVCAQVLMEVRQEGEALMYLRGAMNLKPKFPPHHLLGATIYCRRQSWENALKEANAALKLDAQCAQAYALRGLALWKLQRKEEARQDFERALALDPNHPLSHAARGWLLLDKGEYRAAQEPFREALRLDPFMEWAKEGLLESIKARNPLYRLFLTCLLWMASLSQIWLFAAMLGFSYLLKIVRIGNLFFHKLLPMLRLPLGIVAWISLIFVFLTWVARPLSYLLLRLHPIGRHMLLRSEIAAANWVGVCLLAALGFLIAGLVTDKKPLLMAAMFSVLMMMPTAAVFLSSSCDGRGCLTLYTLVMLGLAIAAVAMDLAGSTDAGWPYGLFLVGFLFFAQIWVVRNETEGTLDLFGTVPRKTDN